MAAADRARKAGPPILPEDLEVLQERAREARERTLASKKHAWILPYERARRRRVGLR